MAPLAVALPVTHSVVFFKRDTPGIDFAMAAIAGRLIAMDGERLCGIVRLFSVPEVARGRIPEHWAAGAGGGSSSRFLSSQTPRLDRMAVLAVGETGGGCRRESGRSPRWRLSSSTAPGGNAGPVTFLQMLDNCARQAVVHAREVGVEKLENASSLARARSAKK